MAKKKTPEQLRIEAQRKKVAQQQKVKRASTTLTKAGFTPTEVSATKGGTFTKPSDTKGKTTTVKFRKDVVAPEVPKVEVPKTDTTTEDVISGGQKTTFTKDAQGNVISSVTSKVDTPVDTTPQGTKSDTDFLGDLGIIDVNTGEISQKDFNRSTLTPEQQEALDRQQQKNRDLTELARIEEETEFAKREEELATQEDTQASIERSLEELESQKDISRKTAEGQEAAISSAVSAEPGTLTASANDAAALAAQQGVKIRSASSQRGFSQQAQNLQTAQRRLDAARKSGDREEIRAAIKDRLTTEERIKELVAAAELERATESDKALEFFDKLSPSSIAALTDEDIEALEEDFIQAGRPAGILTAIIASNEKLAEAQEELTKDPTNQEKINKVLALQGKIDKIKTESAETDAEKNIKGLERLRDNGTLSQEAFERARDEELGITETPKERKTRIRENATLKGQSVSRTPTVTGGASTGVKDENPINFITDFDFGTGKKGSQITDSEGNDVGVISSEFGADHSQISGEESHNALDIVFNKGLVQAMAGGTVIKKGVSDSFGSYAWLQDEDGRVMQYAHLNNQDITGLQTGDFFNAGQQIGRQETNPDLWGDSTGPHTDLRYVGVQDEEENQSIANWGYALLDGRATMGNIPQEIRTEVNDFAQQKTAEGYKSDYPVLTETQLNLVNQLSDDYRADPQQRDMLDVKSGFDGVRTLYGTDEKIARATGFDDVASINAFQRMIDPGATVREGDVTLLQTSIPFLKRVDPAFAWSKFTKGDKLPASVRRSMLRVATDVYNTKAEGFNNTVGDTFQQRADAANVPFDLIGKEFTIYDDGVETPESEIEQNSENIVITNNAQISALDERIQELEAKKKN